MRPRRGPKYQSDENCNMALTRRPTLLEVVTSEDECDVEEILRDIPIPVGASYRRELEKHKSDSYDVPDTEHTSVYNGRIDIKSDVPNWFPEEIKQLFLTDRHGGQFTFKVTILVAFSCLQMLTESL